MASVEDYSYDQSMFKFSNPSTTTTTNGNNNNGGGSGGLGFGFPTNNQLEYFNLGSSQLFDSNYSMNEMFTNIDPLTINSGLNVTPNFFLQNTNFLNLDHQQQQQSQSQQSQSQQHSIHSQQIPQQVPSLMDPLSSDTTSSSSLTPFDQSSNHIPSSVTTSSSSTNFPTNGFNINEAESVFPPVDAFIPSNIDTKHQQYQQQQQLGQQQQQQQHYQRSRYLSEPNIITSTNNDSPFSLSPHSITFSGSTIDGSNSTTTGTSSTNFYETDLNGVVVTKPLYQRYRVIRGISSGGSATKPPRIMTSINHHYVPVNLEILDANLNECCLPKWNEHEKFDKRRIIRIERYQIGSKIVAKFSIVGAAEDHPIPEESQPGVDVVEVSCLECFAKMSEDTDVEDEVQDFQQTNKVYNNNNSNEDETKRSFYITSVEVIKIVELLIGTEVQDPAERRRERGRIRSNLVPFWSKRPISSRMSTNVNNNGNGNMERSNSSSPNSNSNSFNGIDQNCLNDFRIELATRIMGYDVRKPRGFDKEVRILKWEKLVPALRRALQSYYVEIPDGEEEF